MIQSNKPAGRGVEIAPESVRDAFRYSSATQAGAAPLQSAPAIPAPTTPPAPQAPSRMRGRLVIASLLVAACGAGMFTVWDSMLRYRAYGVVTGRIVNVGTPIDGMLKYVHVREGDDVRQGDRLATVIDLEQEMELARIEDQIRLAEATMHAEAARVRWEAHVQETEMTKSVADFFDGVSTVYHETGNLEVLRNELDRTEYLMSRDAAREIDLMRQTIREQAQVDKLSSVRRGLDVLRTRADKALAVPRPGDEQLNPHTAKIQMLTNEAERIRRWVAQGEITSPANGKILKRLHPAGECVPSSDSLFSVMEEASIEIELFLPQEMAADFVPGDIVELQIAPFEDRVPCEVTTIGVEQRNPPRNIEVFYRKDVTLLPVRVKPPAEITTDERLTVGAVAKMPWF